MEEMNLNIKTDYELIRELTRRLNETDKLERTEKLAILKDLEYYVHQVFDLIHFCAYFCPVCAYFYNITQNCMFIFDN